MKLYKTIQAVFLQDNKDVYLIEEDWDTLINRKNLFDHLSPRLKQYRLIDPQEFEKAINNHLLPPIGSQEVWAAGVTYLRSRDARMEESKSSGGADFYDKVYDAERPELFFKALPHRVSGHNGEVYIRKDSDWNVPEPELTLFISFAGTIEGYTIGNDMSSRSIEGENPLYLPQAKVYEKSASLGPCLFVPQQPLSGETVISIRIQRNNAEMFNESITLNKMKRSLTELVSFLYRECDFAQGCFLMTGTGMVPASGFTLQPGDRIDISIEGIGTLTNTVAER